MNTHVHLVGSGPWEDQSCSPVSPLPLPVNPPPPSRRFRRSSIPRLRFGRVNKSPDARSPTPPLSPPSPTNDLRRSGGASDGRGGERRSGGASEGGGRSDGELEDCRVGELTDSFGSGGGGGVGAMKRKKKRKIMTMMLSGKGRGEGMSDGEEKERDRSPTTSSSATAMLRSLISPRSRAGTTASPNPPSLSPHNTTPSLSPHHTTPLRRSGGAELSKSSCSPLPQGRKPGVPLQRGRSAVSVPRVTLGREGEELRPGLVPSLPLKEMSSSPVPVGKKPGLQKGRRKGEESASGVSYPTCCFLYHSYFPSLLTNCLPSRPLFSHVYDGLGFCGEAAASRRGCGPEARQTSHSSWRLPLSPWLFQLSELFYAKHLAHYRDS